MTSLRVAARERSYFPLAVSDLDHALRDVETVALRLVLALPFRSTCASEAVTPTPAVARTEAATPPVQPIESHAVRANLPVMLSGRPGAIAFAHTRSTQSNSHVRTRVLKRALDPKLEQVTAEALASTRCRERHVPLAPAHRPAIA